MHQTNEVRRQFEGGETILHIACKEGDLQVLQLALDCDGDVKQLSKVYCVFHSHELN